MMKAGSVALSIALATTLAACGSRTEQNKAAPQNVMPAPAEPATNVSASENVAATNTMTNAAQTVESTGPAEPRRTPPAPKVAPAPRPSPQDDPHAGHDMSAMNHQ